MGTVRLISKQGSATNLNVSFSMEDEKGAAQVGYKPLNSKENWSILPYVVMNIFLFARKTDCISLLRISPCTELYQIE